MKRMVLAVGGNSLIRAGEKGTVQEEIANARRIAAQIIGLIRDGYRIVLTHGNGPQVGAELLLHERATNQAPAYPLDICDAATQGEIGYLLQQALDNEVKLAGLGVPVVALVTQCVVSLDDPSMSHPTKPIGRFYSRAEAEERKRLFGWEFIEDAGRGYRRVVPSPEPVEIIELDVIRDANGARCFCHCLRRWRYPSRVGEPEIARRRGRNRQRPHFCFACFKAGSGVVRHRDRHRFCIPRLQETNATPARTCQPGRASLVRSRRSFSAREHGT